MCQRCMESAGSMCTHPFPAPADCTLGRQCMEACSHTASPEHLNQDSKPELGIVQTEGRGVTERKRCRGWTTLVAAKKPAEDISTTHGPRHCQPASATATVHIAPQQPYSLDPAHLGTYAEHTGAMHVCLTITLVVAESYRLRRARIHTYSAPRPLNAAGANCSSQLQSSCMCTPFSVQLLFRHHRGHFGPILRTMLAQPSRSYRSHTTAVIGKFSVQPHCRLWAWTALITGSSPTAVCAAPARSSTQS